MSRERGYSVKGLRDSVRFVSRIRGGVSIDDKNIALILDKFVPFKKGKFDYSKVLGERKCFEIPEEVKRRINRRVRLNGFRVLEWEGELEGGLIIGMGAPHVHETTLSFHKPWGVPYIPGTALKGLLRTYYIERALQRIEGYAPSCMDAFLSGEPHPKDVGHKEEQCPVWQSQEKLVDEVNEFRRIFGTKEGRGGVIFMDAFPSGGSFCLKMDVMSVHYMDYYTGRGNVPPADWSSPIIIAFMKVVDTKFRGLIISDVLDESQLNAIKVNMKKALSLYGIGAKTSVGYGVIKVIE